MSNAKCTSFKSQQRRREAGGGLAYAKRADHALHVEADGHEPPVSRQEPLV